MEVNLALLALRKYFSSLELIEVGASACKGIFLIIRTIVNEITIKLLSMIQES